MLGARFPHMAACIDANETRQRLNRSMRWAAAREIPVSAPQLYVDGTKVCLDGTDVSFAVLVAAVLDRKGDA
jgi:hypothetical protein